MHHIEVLGGQTSGDDDVVQDSLVQRSCNNLLRCSKYSMLAMRQAQPLAD